MWTKCLCLPQLYFSSLNEGHRGQKPPKIMGPTVFMSPNSQHTCGTSYMWSVLPIISCELICVMFMFSNDKSNGQRCGDCRDGDSTGFKARNIWLEIRTSILHPQNWKFCLGSVHVSLSLLSTTFFRSTQVQVLFLEHMILKHPLFASLAPHSPSLNPSFTDFSVIFLDLSIKNERIWNLNWV